MGPSSRSSSGFRKRPSPAPTGIPLCWNYGAASRRCVLTRSQGTSKNSRTCSRISSRFDWLAQGYEIGDFFQAFRGYVGGYDFRVFAMAGGGYREADRFVGSPVGIVAEQFVAQAQDFPAGEALQHPAMHRQ